MRTLPAKVQTAVHVATLARKAGLPIPAKVLPILEAAAAPWPAEWLLAPLPGDPIRVVELFAGPGGWSEGIAAVLGVAIDSCGVDISPDACATARKAGHRRICADITTLDPEHIALRYTVAVIISPPCPTFSPAGKLSGLEARNIGILCDAISYVGEAAGFLPVEEVFDYHDEDDYDENGDCPCGPYDGCNAHFAPRSGATWDEVREMAADVSDPRIALMLEVAIWPIALQAAGAPIRWMVMEQSSNLPEDILDDLSTELTCAEWFYTNREIMEAADYGLPSRRKRVYMIASRRYSPTTTRRIRPLPATTMAQALGWKPGERVNTRGNRPVDPTTGRAKGGNTFSADGPSWCLTGKSRTWKRESDGYRLTESEAGLLVGFRRSYPWQGSRTSTFQQAADVVSPVMAAIVLSGVLGVLGEALVRDYLAQLYEMDDMLNPDDYALAT
ncbi:DNA cytosine methyltransferase [Streptomyces sp. SP18BB07]|uniref:DNA cytosine methyltransferase n=1 Tax=Streptomyces sp. SP18BB07 TaxID=3002522 RepID=UPI002E778452|nr:DNA cytosine methyltransferase [Streptomyces sp. SP18BB07]MEE1764338.1 DNA cytosine methyltransferase [Streptomyces sp. SP18BB07]